MKRGIILSLTIYCKVFCQFIPLEEHLGMAHLRVNVAGAENNPQTVLFDTGSKHSYLLSNRAMAEVLNRQPAPGVRAAGIRGSLIHASEISRQVSDTIVHYAAFASVQLNRWTRKRFTIHNGLVHSWNQKFAIASLDPSEIYRWFPSHLCGVIGASPDSRFAQQHPFFGITPRPTREGIKYNLFLERIRPIEWCRDQLVVRYPISVNPGFNFPMWLITSTRLDLIPRQQPQFGYPLIAGNYQLLIDTGFSCLFFPRVIHYRLREYIVSLNIPSLDYPLDSRDLPTIHQADIGLLPDLLISLPAGVTIRIPNDKITVCDQPASRCRVLIGYGNYPVIAIGAPLFSTLIVEYDVSDARIAFCEPIPSDGIVSSPPLITHAGTAPASPPSGHLEPPPRPPAIVIPPPIMTPVTDPGSPVVPSTVNSIDSGMRTPSLIVHPTENSRSDDSEESISQSPAPISSATKSSSNPAEYQHANTFSMPYRPPQLPNDLVDDTEEDDDEAEEEKEHKGQNLNFISWITIAFLTIPNLLI